jgi:hypothetical protein
MASNQDDLKSNDYLAALVRKVSQLKEVPNNILHADEIRKIQRDPAALAKFTDGKPHLQEQLASLTNFTPSQWLLAQEIPAIRQRRLLLTKTDHQFAPSDDPYRWARVKKLQGICFSGGGIRSATLNLGILQGLAGLPHKDDEPGMLSRFDYLSSVSGGGYIHEWFAAWVKRESLPEVEKKLKPLPDSGQPCHPEPIRWLRKYSNYLTPQKGLLTGDTWVAVAIWFRNTFLNQLILVSILFLLLHLPNLVAPYLIQKSEVGFVPTAVILFLLALASITYTLRHEYDRITGGPPAPSEKGFARKGLLDRGNETTIQFAVILPLLMAGVFYLKHIVNQGVSKWDVAGVFLSQWLLVASLAFAGACLDVYKMARGLTAKPSGWKRVWYEIRIILVAIGGVVLFNAAVAAAGGTLLLLGANWLLHAEMPASLYVAIGQPDDWKLQITFGPAMMLAVSFMSLVLGAGLIGRDFRDWLLEWLGRVRAWAVLFGVLWVGYFGIALLGPFLFSAPSGWVKGVKWTAVVTWVLTTAGAVLAGQSAKTGGAKDSEKTAGTLALLTTFGPPIFILGLLLLISKFAALCGTSTSNGWTFWVPLAAPLFIFVLFGFRVDINDFSMNPFYRNRLTRCYLGATNDQRDPNPLTGFDDRDTAGMQMSQLLPPGMIGPGSSSAAGAAGGTAATQTSGGAQTVEKGYLGPYPIICTTINLTFGQDLAWQERKAASFAFTPLYCGYHVGWTAGTGKCHLSFNGFAPTDLYAIPNGGINIATAVAISGAAASPNMGYHSNPSIAFLLTMFNVRLGWWLFNPRRSKFAGKAVGPASELPEWPSPRFAPFELGKELLGMANDESKYVYLSDGGHFDNMGLYELVRRRCYRIVICDAEQDEEHMFGGIASAIRKCRIDFGVEITLDLEALRPNKKTGRCKAHHVLGTIRYPETPDDKSVGIILYIKPSLTGTIKREKEAELPCEPIDILNYRFEHSTFPHDSTANQWFTESQFESYRRLGQHMVAEVDSSGGWKEFLG